MPEISWGLAADGLPIECHLIGNNEEDFTMPVKRLTKEEAVAIYEKLTGAQREVMYCLFVHGPTWDGNVPSKSARGDLFDMGLAMRYEGFTTLTLDGLAVAVRAPRREYHNPPDRPDRWYLKQQA